MKIEYSRSLNDREKEMAKSISDNCGILYDTAKLLLYRNIDTVEKAKAFLNPNKSRFFNPFLLSDMQKAVDRINFALQTGEKVLVFGDYDADGICASSMLYHVLREFGITTYVVVPEREDGYGLNYDKIKNFIDKYDVKLVITVDCGISDVEGVKKVQESGADVIITDHHEPPLILPECIRINPKIKGQDYPFEGLCGAGVAYKLCYALVGEKADKYLDLVCLATISDSMDLVGENRDIVYEGLKLFTPTRIRKNFKYIIDLSKKITSQTIAFQLAPRVNAGGRMGDANCALKLLISDDENEIFDLSAKLNEYNIARQVECDAIYKEAKQKIEAECLNDNILMVFNEKWKTGFVGIVAARLVEDYNKPAIVFAGNDGYLKGSARSVDGINIFETISGASDLLITFGGHSQAAGVSVSKENFYKLKEVLSENLKGKIVSGKEKTVYAEWEIKDKISIRFAKEIDMLEPFGVGNKRPAFTIETDKILSRPIKETSPHYTFNTKYLEMLDFNGKGNCYELSLPIKKNILFELNYSIFRDKESVKGFVKNVIVEKQDYEKIKLFVLRQSLLGEREFPEYESQLKNTYSKLTADREVFVKFYNELSRKAGASFYNSADYFYNSGDEQGVFCTEVFLELGFFKIKNGVILKGDYNKKNLTESEIYKKVYRE